MKDVVITVVLGIVLAIAFMYALLSLAFSGWGDRSREALMPPPPNLSIPLSRLV